jgi:DNA-binding CsgD family transcriptional regulator
VLGLISAGRTNIEIAGVLAISAYTVKNHVQRIIRKLGAANRTEATAMYLQFRGSARNDVRSPDTPRLAALTK